MRTNSFERNIAMAYDRSSLLDRREFLTRMGSAGVAVSLALNESANLF